ncbi:hypothetical protein ACS0PU_011529 [Formica fusca]
MSRARFLSLVKRVTDGICLCILEDVHDIHKRKQLREHGIDGLHVVAGIFSGNSPFLSLSMVLISREIREAQGFTLAASGRIQNERELAGVKDERVFQL